ncbi:MULTISPECIES: hypothetical protein [unclassified Mesorhizobium]|uniref:hypothetical protein n=1 Tax=unclassified Mesorhizobium TaxID=325217 RepID=UPI0033356191
MTMMHAAVAVRAYLQAAGLPEFDQANWSKARELLLGQQAAKDNTNFLKLDVSSSAAQSSLEANSSKIAG